MMPRALVPRAVARGGKPVGGIKPATACDPPLAPRLAPPRPPAPPLLLPLPLPAADAQPKTNEQLRELLLKKA